MQAATPAIRLRISSRFWMVALLPGIRGGLRGMAIWGAIVFGSVLWHELGHVLVGLSSSRRVLIVLDHLGGHTEFEPGLSTRRGTVSTFAGPFLSLLLGAGIFITHRALALAPWLSVTMWVNLGWGAFNILPIVPFDGGRLLIDRLGTKRPDAALIISTATVAAALTVGVVTIRSTGFAILFVSLALVSLFQLAKEHERLRNVHLDAQLRAAHLLILGHRHDEAIRVSEGVLVQARDFQTRNAALTMLAWAHLGQARPSDAMRALAKVLPPEAADAYTLAAVQRASRQVDDAVQTLERARTRPSFGREAARLLVDLYAERGDLERAFATTLAHLRLLGPEDARLVVQALEQAEDFRHAATLSQAITAPFDPIA